jgi:sortase (surface protein transpeptidase)
MPHIPRAPEPTPRQAGSVIRRRRRGGPVPPVAMAAAALLGGYLIHDGTTAQGGPPRPASADSTAAPVPSSGDPAPLPFAAPSRIRIPAIRVNAPVMRVGRDNDGGVGVPPPADKNLAAWYGGGPAPGQSGTAVMDGHVDNKAGPAVFYNLGALHRGDHVEVTRADGRTAVFTVYGIELFAKSAFPAKRVYDDTGRPELRVITCGGAFSRRTGYAGNVVVFARLTGTR